MVQQPSELRSLATQEAGQVSRAECVSVCPCGRKTQSYKQHGRGAALTAIIKSLAIQLRSGAKPKTIQCLEHEMKYHECPRGDKKAEFEPRRVWRW